MTKNRSFHTRRRVTIVATCLWILAAFPAQAAPAHAGDPGDDYLAGYLSSILENQYHWEHASYRVDVQDGVAIITLPHDDPERRREAAGALAQVAGVREYHIQVEPALAAPDGARHFPRDDVFPPLLADPREPQTYASVVKTGAATGRVSAGLLGIGNTFGVFRWPARDGGFTRQLGISLGIFSQFNLAAPSADLVNSDYLLAFPLTFRRGDFSARTRLLHQSSHLGDESILRGTAPERVDIDFEAVDLLLARDRGGWRVYAGGEYIIQRIRTDLKRQSLRAGLEYRGDRPVLARARLVAGLDTRWLEQRRWAAGTGLKLGLEFGAPHPDRRGARLMLEAYTGFVPFGQFYVYDVKYVGLGYYLDY